MFLTKDQRTILVFYQNENKKEQREPWVFLLPKFYFLKKPLLAISDSVTSSHMWFLFLHMFVFWLMPYPKLLVLEQDYQNGGIWP